MYSGVRVLVGTVLSVIALLLVGNVKGFFTSPWDDPAWEDPAPAAGAMAQAGGAAGGPGASLFKSKCAVCHQETGKGLPGIYPALAGSELLQGDETRPARIILHGFQGKINRGGKEYNGVMPGFSQLTDDEIAQILSYARSAWGNTGSAVEAASVADIRAKTAGRATAFTEAELDQPL